MPDGPYKPCSRCGKELSLDRFSRNAKSKDGRHYWCRPCYKEYNAERTRRRAREWAAANPERTRERGASWRTNNREHVRAYMRARNIRQQYGIEVEEYDAIVAQPCGICGTTERRRVLDHDHETGTLRGALCPTCNSGIGMLNDDLELLRAAVAYLERPANQQLKEALVSRYEVREADDGSFYYVVLGANGEVLSTSETYTRKSDAERGVEDARAANEQESE